MIEIWIRLDDLPAEGRDLTFSDQDFWFERFAAFGLGVRPGKDIQAIVHVTLQGKDALIRGQITGSAQLSCDRCAEEFEFNINTTFDEFESADAENEGEESRIDDQKGVLMLNMGDVLWEQLMLALPVKPTCAESCQGICPDCGTNLNTGKCSCVREEGDSRLAVLRGLKVE